MQRLRNTRMTRIIVLLILSLLMMLKPLTSVAEEGRTLFLNEGRGYVGEKVRISLSIDEVKDLAGIQFTLIYDGARLELTDRAVTTAPVLNSFIKDWNVNTEQSYLKFTAATAQEISLTDDAVLLTLDFSIKANAMVGDTPVQFSTTLISDGKRSLSHRTEDAVVKVLEKSGDSNGVLDGETPKVEGSVDTRSQIHTEDSENGVVVKVEMPLDSLSVAVIPENVIEEILETAQKLAADEERRAIIELWTATIIPTTSMTVIIPRNFINELENFTNLVLRVNVEIGILTFDAVALQSLSESGHAGDVSIVVSRSSLSEEKKKVLGDRPIYDFSVFVGQYAVSTFGGSKITVNIPYMLRAGEEDSFLIVYSVTHLGDMETIRGRYNASSKTMDFVTGHFSEFIIGYNEVHFNDLKANAWYKDPINFLAARGITNGTGNGNFSPNYAITRAEFIVMLLKSYGIMPIPNEKNNFIDAKSNYYTDYLATAKASGIAKGIGENKFAPEAFITRQELFTLLYRALTVLGEVPTTKVKADITDFADAEKIADYSSESVSALVNRGIITGNGKELDPTGKATRAQVAQIFYTLLTQ